MTKFTTNRGSQIEAENIRKGIKQFAENLILLEGERLKCPLKLHSLEAAQSSRLRGVAVRAIAIPDLPDFVSRVISSTPEIDCSFLIQPSADITGDEWQVEGNGETSLFYHGETWEAVASQHCYFTAFIGAMKDGIKVDDQIFVNLNHIGPGHTHGSIMRGGEAGGNAKLVSVEHDGDHSACVATITTESKIWEDGQQVLKPSTETRRFVVKPQTY